MRRFHIFMKYFRLVLLKQYIGSVVVYHIDEEFQCGIGGGDPLVLS